MLHAVSLPVDDMRVRVGKYGVKRLPRHRAQRQLVSNGPCGDEGRVLVATETRCPCHKLRRHLVLVEHIFVEHRLASVEWYGKFFLFCYSIQPGSARLS